MKALVKLYLGIFAALLLLGSCSNHKDNDSFSDVLTAPPFGLLSDSIKKDPSQSELYFRRAVLLNNSNLSEPALVDFKKAWALEKKEKYAFAIGNLLLENKPDSCAPFLEDALKAHPQSVLLRITLARAFALQKKADDALNICNEIIKINPQHIEAILLAADLLNEKKQPDAAIGMMEKAYAFNSKNIELGYKLAYQYAENKNPKAISLSDELAKTDSLQEHAEPFYCKGIYYSNTGNFNPAITQFNEAIKRNLNFDNAYIEKGRALLLQKKQVDAYKVFHLLMSKSPDNPDAYFWIAKCQQTTGNLQEAKLNFQRAYELDKTFLAAKEAADSIKE